MKSRNAPRPRSIRPASIDSLADLVGSLKKSVSVKLTRQFRTRVPAALIQRAIDEAEELARGSGFPHLFLPELAAEQVRRVHATVVRDNSEIVLHHAA